jgi:hypothetical protein
MASASLRSHVVPSPSAITYRPVDGFRHVADYVPSCFAEESRRTGFVRRLPLHLGVLSNT